MTGATNKSELKISLKAACRKCGAILNANFCNGTPGPSYFLIEVEPCPVCIENAGTDSWNSAKFDSKRIADELKKESK